MSKVRVTRKYLRDNYACITVGYCDLCYLLYYKAANFYTCGIYGWNFDGYSLYHKALKRSVVITTGYRGMIDNCANNNSYKLAAKYNALAKEEIDRFKFTDSYDNLIEKLEVLQQQYLDEVFNVA